MTVGVLPGDLTLTINEDGEKVPKLVLSSAYNVIPLWLCAAYEHLRKSKEASELITTDWNEDTDHQKSLLVKELTPSIQVFVSCGIALDALYDTLRPHAKLTPQEIQTWKDNGTSRAKQIVEVVRRVFKLNGDTLKNIRDCILQVIKYRDMAVHPSLKLKNTCTRPDLDVGVDWKFSAYRFSNAEWCLTNTINMIVYLYEHETGESEVDTSISNIIDALEELNVVQRNA